MHPIQFCKLPRCSVFIYTPEASSDVDRVGMFLAQRFVFFGKERLTFQTGGADLRRETNRWSVCSRTAQEVFTHVLRSETVVRTYRTHKTGVMPGEPQSLQELVSRFDWEVAAVAGSPKHGVVIWIVHEQNVKFVGINQQFCLAWLRVSYYSLYLFHSKAARPPCETCCSWSAVGRRHRQNKTRARSVLGHSWFPARKMNQK